MSILSRLIALLLLPVLLLGSTPACALAVLSSRERTVHCPNETARHLFAAGVSAGAAGLAVDGRKSHANTSDNFDRARGLYYLRARMMNPLTGRFWSADSYEGRSSDPASLHRYLYANGHLY